MRIVGGSHKGRPLITPQNSAIRPTSDRAREAIFNLLSHAAWLPEDRDILESAIVLDVFCGTGAFAFEALSRGASLAFCLDTSKAALGLVHQNADSLGLKGQLRTLSANATSLPTALAKATLVFLDPPYREGLLTKTLASLPESGWLADGALIIVETDSAAPETIPDCYEILDTRRYGRALISFLMLKTVNTNP